MSWRACLCSHPHVVCVLSSRYFYHLNSRQLLIVVWHGTEYRKLFIWLDFLPRKLYLFQLHRAVMHGLLSKKARVPAATLSDRITFPELLFEMH